MKALIRFVWFAVISGVILGVCGCAGGAVTLDRPAEGAVVIPYGRYQDPFTGITRNSGGVVYSYAQASPVRAAGAGTVYRVATDPRNYGLYLIIQHNKELQTLYAHLGSVEVQEGQRVQRGQLIAKTGNSGRATTASQLQFAVFVSGEAQDPEPYFTAE